jgi:hypothetical protein
VYEIGVRTECRARVPKDVFATDELEIGTRCAIGIPKNMFSLFLCVICIRTI